MSNLTITKDAEKDQKFDKPVRRQCLFYLLCFIVKCKQELQFIGAHISGIRESAIEHIYSKQVNNTDCFYI